MGSGVPTTFWRLQVQLGSQCWILHGEESLMRSAFDELTEAINSVDGLGPKAITVHGFTNSADRAAQDITVVVEHVQAVDLCRMV